MCRVRQSVAQLTPYIMRPLRIGTRGSALALAQTDLVVAALRTHNPGVEIDVQPVKTEGDRNQHDSLRIIGGRGAFARDIEQRLAEGDIDAAVHSMKDLPTSDAPDMASLVIVAVPPRASPFDVLIAPAGGLADLPVRARVGTSSPRRAAFMRALRPDAHILDIRGNIGTRLRKLDEGGYDAVLLAEAALIRLDLGQRIAHTFDATDMLPAPGQGALAVQCRADDATTRALLSAIDHAPSHVATTAERAFLRAAGAGCRWPVAALATVADSGELVLHAAIARESEGEGAGSIFRGVLNGSATDADAIGAQLAERLLRESGGGVLS